MKTSPRDEIDRIEKNYSQTNRDITTTMKTPPVEEFPPAETPEETKHIIEEAQVHPGLGSRYNAWRKSFNLPNPGPFEQLHKEVRGIFII